MPDVKPVVAIVDPISTGASLAKFLSEKGYPLVRVFSDTLPDEVRCSWKSRWLSLQPGSTEACFSTETVPRAAPSFFGRTGRTHRPCRPSPRPGEGASGRGS